MKTKLINLLKYNRSVYSIYYYAMSFAINALKVFVKTDSKLILFNSFAGRKFDDSPKELFEYIKKDKRFKDYKLVWAFHNPQQFQVDGAQVIKTDGFKYFITALKARVWITNSSVERGLNFKGKNTFYLNTWHGTPLKKMGSDIADNNTAFKTKTDNKFDAMNAQSKFEADIFSRVFSIPREKFLEVGLPRNDKLVNYSDEDRKQIRERLGIPENKRVILYCPTFREYEKDENNGCVLAPPMDLEYWRKNLGKDYVLLFRAHYEVAKVMGISVDDFVLNMTDYQSLNELMIASDILISDYSSVFFDYSVMNKVMLHFTYDFDKYSSLRGMYFDVRDYLDGADNEKKLVEIINEMDYQEEKQKTKLFRDRYVNYSGQATKLTVDYLATKLGI